ncbi:MAG: PTS system fructose-specific EIIABC component [candidate division BRC1 bacterium ADurb.BinA364]|nr:MAG: PTS system fructose-specific EIIABC component [candidate division BRC1 bacterium ADurb.BinA364]
METPKLCDLVDAGLIKDLDSVTKSEALDEMIELICQSERIVDRAAFREAVLARERLMSTGIGLSVAVPHVKISAVSDYVVAIGRSRSGIEFDSLDSQPVRLIFMVGASDRQAGAFVKLLARIVTLIKNGTTRLALLEADDPEGIRDALLAAESAEERAAEARAKVDSTRSGRSRFGKKSR